MKGLFTKIAAVVLGLSMATGVGVAVAANSSSVISAEATNATIAGGTNATACKVNSSSTNGYKLGTSSKGGSMTIKVGSGAKQLTFYASAWTGVKDLKLNITPTNKISAVSIPLSPNSGISGSGTSYTISGSVEDYKYTFALSDITSDTTFTLETSTTKRCAIWNATYETTAPTTYIVGFAPGTDATSKEGDIYTKSDVKVAISNMSNASYYQIYKNKSGTISGLSGTTITKIQFTCTATGTSKYGPGNASVNTGTYSYDSSLGTWTGNSVSSVTFSATEQIRMNLLNVTVYTGPSITKVTMSGSPSSGEIVLGTTEWTMSATVTATNDSGQTLSRNVNWTVSPAGAVTFSSSTSASGSSITVKATNANASDVIITASSAATGYTSVCATSNTFSIAKKGTVTSVTVATSDGQTIYDADGATSYTVNLTTSVIYDGTAGSSLVDLEVSPNAGVTLSATKNFTAGAFTANFSIEGTYTITSTSVEDGTKSDSVTIHVRNIEFVGYELINSSSDIIPSKGKYVFYFVKNSLSKSVSTASIYQFHDNHFDDVEYTAPGTIIPASDVASNTLHVFSFETAQGGYYLKDETDNKYITWTPNGTSNNCLSEESSTATAGVWTISEEDGIFKIIPNSDLTRWFEYNNDPTPTNHRITCYAGTQHSELYLYKLNDNSKAFVLDQNTVYTSYLACRTINAVAKNGASATVSWSIADTSIARITSTSGLSVEIEGLVNSGSTTLTATFTALDGETYPALTCTIQAMDIPEHVEIGVTTFTKVTSMPSGGWDGVYLFVDENSNTVLNGSKVPVSGYKSVTITNNTIPASVENIACSFMIASVSGSSNYTINSYSDNYIGNWTADKNYLMSSYNDAYEVTISSAGLITALQSDNTTSTNTELKAWGVLGTDENYGIKFYKSSTTQGVYPISLYKANGEVREISSTLRTFYNNNKDNLHCVDTSKTQGSSTINWSAIQTAYSALGTEDKGTLTQMAAKAAELNGNYLEAFISRYDYCVAKLGYTDFMGREAAGTLSVARSSNSMINFLSEAGDAGIVIAVASLLGLATLTGYFFVRKRKVH